MVRDGTVIDNKFEVESTLGAGGFGTVYAALQTQFGRRVAVKTLNTTILGEADGLGRFEREAKAISALQHKNIVAFYGYGVWQNAPYMAMELVDGESLDFVLAREEKLEALRCLRMIKQVLEGLSAAHAAGIIHRDLKPSNIVITSTIPEGVKLIDFGLAGLMPSFGVNGQKLTETGFTLGSCYYMSPEQALGGNVDQRADIYAVGCILYQMLTGVLPFDDADNVAIMYKHLNSTPRPLSDYMDSRAPIGPISVFVNNCMAKQAEQRYQNAGDALADLEALLRGEFKLVSPLAERQLKSVGASGGSKTKLMLALSVVAVSIVSLAAVSVAVFHQDQHEGSDLNQRLARVEAALLNATRSDAEVAEAYDIATHKELMRAWSQSKQARLFDYLLFTLASKPLTRDSFAQLRKIANLRDALKSIGASADPRTAQIQAALISFGKLDDIHASGTDRLYDLRNVCTLFASMQGPYAEAQFNQFYPQLKKAFERMPDANVITPAQMSELGSHYSGK